MTASLLLQGYSGTYQGALHVEAIALHGIGCILQPLHLLLLGSQDAAVLVLQVCMVQDLLTDLI